ncbi:short-chain dehydrogenase/reductase SDR (plasmid) [Gloeothece citriformis PCC 7424]|uniref:Short-chain dehydrogenase/reductase SDR n=1 Tax=Gloeothece citriformis (strain PCC 7424) TaxID=65393 RepID=B7KLV2_GLOC7|nr:SDR family NAD(P)-dependent oxidoreductase [Gloeothece citriformis]ACK73774.1 short-chain dehydrogenase/reductase SDR [Gloeothece citriformis PCC 7424]
MNSIQHHPYFFILVAVGTFVILFIFLRWWQESRYNFKDKTVLITGGSRGLGLVMARHLLRQGARLAICGRDTASLEVAKTELEETGGKVLTIPCDVSNLAQVQQLIETVNTSLGDIDVLINNAGIIQVGPYQTMTLSDYETAMKVHFWGPLYTSQAVVPTMRKRKTGRIVNISSIGGKISVPHLLPYSASKFALVGLSQGMRSELARDGIIVTTVCPGLMQTGSTENAFFKGHHRSEYTWFSLSDSLPIVSMSADAAARQILAACRRGASEVILSIPAQIATRFHGLFPGLTSDLLKWVNRLLPSPGGIGDEQRPGKASHSSLSPSALTVLNNQAIRHHNELETDES